MNFSLYRADLRRRTHVMPAGMCKSRDRAVAYSRVADERQRIMGLISGIWLAVLGALGASNLIIARKPDAEAYLAKLAPYQGWIGAVSAFWGVWGIIQSVLWLGMLAAAPIYWGTFAASAVVQFALGLLLGIGVLKTFIKNEEAVRRLDQLVTKLAPKQGVLGLVAIGLGVWMIVVNFLFAVAG